MKTRITVFVYKELENWWGIDDLLEDNADKSVAKQDKLIAELLWTDLPSFLDGATFKVARTEDAPRTPAQEMNERLWRKE